MKKPYFATFRVELARLYHVECRVTPARPAPHAGPDSPRYMEPGTRGSVRILAVLEDAVWRDPADLRPETRQAIQESCERQAGVHGSVLAIPAGQSELPLEANR